MTTHHKSLLPTGFLLKKSNGTQNIYPRTRGHHWPVCLLSCFCSLYFSLQKSYGIISNIAATRLPDFHRQRRFRQGAYQAGQAAPASRLRVQRYGEIQPYARKTYEKVWKFAYLQEILGRADCKTQENSPNYAFLSPGKGLGISWKVVQECGTGGNGQDSGYTHLIIYYIYPCITYLPVSRRAVFWTGGQPATPFLFQWHDTDLLHT